MPRTLMNGFTIIISLTRPAPHIRLLAMIMELDAVQRLSARIAFLTEDAGLKKGQRSTELKNSDWLQDNKI